MGKDSKFRGKGISEAAGEMSVYLMTRIRLTGGDGLERTYPRAAKTRYLEYGMAEEMGHCRSMSKGLTFDTIL